jgi:hypothetical protein
MSDTPRTDALSKTAEDIYELDADEAAFWASQYADLARTLERQNAELLAALKGIVAAADANQAAIVLTLIAQAREAIRRAEA